MQPLFPACAFWNLAEWVCSDDDTPGDPGSGTCWLGDAPHKATRLPQPSSSELCQGSPSFLLPGEIRNLRVNPGLSEARKEPSEWGEQVGAGTEHGGHVAPGTLTTRQKTCRQERAPECPETEKWGGHKGASGGHPQSPSAFPNRGHARQLSRNDWSSPLPVWMAGISGP